MFYVGQSVIMLHMPGLGLAWEPMKINQIQVQGQILSIDIVSKKIAVEFQGYGYHRDELYNLNGYRNDHHPPFIYRIFNF